MTTAPASLLLDAARAAAGGQVHPGGALYVVATPIGNLADITLRAIHVLAIADAVACEDTRHSAPLLQQLGIAGKPLLAVHEHNERSAADAVLARLAAGQRVAFVSDAGTPAVSDPGAALVAAVRAAGHRVLPIPGASSAVAALSAAGDAQSPGGFVFVGFLGTRGSERAQAVERLAAEARTQILFEAPHRIDALARSLAAACGSRAVTVCRELTKQFESITTLACTEWPAWLAADPNRGRGEFVIVLHALADAGAAEAAVSPAHAKALETLLGVMPLKQAVALAAELGGGSRNALYERALAIRREQDDAPD